MKLILSRKGLDSSSGGIPSPILPDGTLCWIPIPEESPTKPGLPKYVDLTFQGWNLGEVVETLSGGKLSRNSTVHLDPNIYDGWRESLPGWVPAFGQWGAAEGHLRNNNVGPGDLFLFFAWFRQTEIYRGKLRYVPGSPDIHVIYGWLLVGERKSVDISAEWEPGLKVHPHVIGEPYGSLDAVYLASSQDKDCSLSIPGSAGLFDRLNESRILTLDGASRSIWCLPADFRPAGRDALSYHGDLSRWEQIDNERVKLRTVVRGQEFVLDLESYPGVAQWIERDIFSHPEEWKVTAHQH